jgi:cytochrome c oxidase assembly protein subunit 15
LATKRFDVGAARDKAFRFLELIMALLSYPNDLSDKPQSDIHQARRHGAGNGDFGEILACGFGTSGLMWALGYVCRMPGAAIPAGVILALMLLALVLGGGFAAATTNQGWRGGLFSGVVAGIANLLILGTLGHDLTTDHRIIDYMLLWGFSSLALSGLLGVFGALIGQRLNPERESRLHGEGAFTLITACITLLLILAGGMVTGFNAGLSVPDWPDVFRYNMFLFPLTRMTGGVYFEHTHRLLGTLVGLATMTQAVYLWFRDHRRWVKGLAILALLMVIGQGILGGLRVTGHFTGDQSRIHMDPSTRLAIVHATFGQIVFAVLVAIAVVCSRSWRSNLETVSRGGVGTDFILSWTLVFLLIIQLSLGAILRHTGRLLVWHIGLATVLLLLAMFVGIRTWALHQDEPILRRLGVALLSVVGLQVLLGVGAVIATDGGHVLAHPLFWQAMVTTAHQFCGAVLLATALMLALWTLRFQAKPHPRLEQPAKMPAVR